MFIKRKLLLLVALCAMVPVASGQEQLLEGKGDIYDDFPSRGANRTHYYHPYITWGLHLGSAQAMDIRTHRSHYFDLGIRYKLKFNRFLSAGYEVALSNSSFCLSDDPQRSFPDTIRYDRERINLLALETGLYYRINVDKRRGNYIGNFIDLGVYGRWNALSRYSYRHKPEEDRVVKYSKYYPDYVNALNYGVFVRVAYNRLVLFGRYRLSNALDFKLKDTYLPQVTAGIQIGIHK